MDDGDELGMIVGDTVGLWLGLAVDGADEGCCVGFDVLGAIVGADEGLVVVGLVVEGACVGMMEGTNDGKSEGCNDWDGLEDGLKESVGEEDGCTGAVGLEDSSTIEDISCDDVVDVANVDNMVGLGDDTNVGVGDESSFRPCVPWRHHITQSETTSLILLTAAH
jgi:hypothetical protein